MRCKGRQRRAASGLPPEERERRGEVADASNSEDSVLEIVARLIESERANRKPRNTSEPWPSYRAGLAPSQGCISIGCGWS